MDHEIKRKMVVNDRIFLKQHAKIVRETFLKDPPERIRVASL